jgi:hypothetical protein
MFAAFVAMALPLACAEVQAQSVRLVRSERGEPASPAHGSTAGATESGAPIDTSASDAALNPASRPGSSKTLTSRYRYFLTYEAIGSERLCRAMRPLLNDPRTTPGCLGKPGEMDCRIDAFPPDKYPEFSLPEWQRLDPREHPRILRALSDFNVRYDPDGSGSEWVWKNTHQPKFEQAMAAGLLWLQTAQIDVNNDGTPEPVFRVDVRPGGNQSEFFQAVLDPVSIQPVRSIWDESSMWTPFFYEKSTYWFRWEGPHGWNPDDQRYRSPNALLHLGVTRIRPGSDANIFSSFYFDCTFAIKEIR